MHSAGGIRDSQNPTRSFRIVVGLGCVSMARSEITVNLGEWSYPIVVTSGELERIGEFARTRSSGVKALIVCDQNTTRPFGEIVTKSLVSAGLDSWLHALYPGE